ncbi:MAG: hypothetical protein NZ898_11835 [Myxococcota bacterium]|nr:hypothetical protein [Myxococcota bacterium]MDW8362773.1 hypothetical protein [Myxococcales bacterium]
MAWLVVVLVAIAAPSRGQAEHGPETASALGVPPEGHRPSEYDSGADPSAPLVAGVTRAQRSVIEALAGAGGGLLGTLVGFRLGCLLRSDHLDGCRDLGGPLGLVGLLVGTSAGVAWTGNRLGANASWLLATLGAAGGLLAAGMIVASARLEPPDGVLLVLGGAVGGSVLLFEIVSDS